MSPSALPLFGLDLGSNTFSAVLLSRDNAGHPHVIKDVSYVVRLSEGLVPGGDLTPMAVERGLEAIESIKTGFLSRPVRSRAVSTAVLRMTRHPKVFTQPAEDILGMPVEIITPEEEARLTAEGALVGLAASLEHTVVLDIGGQSTELCFREEGSWRPLSLPMGVVGLTETFGSQLEALRDEVRRVLIPHTGGTAPTKMVAVAGTPTTLAMLETGLTTWQRERVHGTPLTLARVKHWRTVLEPLSSAQRTAVHGIEPGRADVFLAGLIVLEEALSLLGLDTLQVSANGLRTGAALSMQKEHP